METTLEVEFMCTGHYAVERVGYYAGCGTLTDFKIWLNNNDVTEIVPRSVYEELEKQYINMCQSEAS